MIIFFFFGVNVFSLSDFSIAKKNISNSKKQLTKLALLNGFLYASCFMTNAFCYSMVVKKNDEKKMSMIEYYQYIDNEKITDEAKAELQNMSYYNRFKRLFNVHKYSLLSLFGQCLIESSIGDYCMQTSKKIGFLLLKDTRMLSACNTLQKSISNTLLFKRGGLFATFLCSTAVSLATEAVICKARQYMFEASPHIYKVLFDKRLMSAASTDVDVNSGKAFMLVFLWATPLFMYSVPPTLIRATRGAIFPRNDSLGNKCLWGLTKSLFDLYYGQYYHFY